MAERVRRSSSRTKAKAIPTRASSGYGRNWSTKTPVRAPKVGENQMVQAGPDQGRSSSTQAPKAKAAISGKITSLVPKSSEAATMTGGRTDCQVEVVAIERPPDRDLFADDAAWKESCAVKANALRQSLNKARELLLEAGLSASAVTTKFVESCRSPLRESRECSINTSIALEVLRLAEEGGFGTVVVGRRGVSRQEEFLFGSVSSKIIHAAKDLAVWVVA